ncbi:MAG: ATP-binding cassette domain-containing protein [Thermoanaerobacteraceae bacterium]|nr:ATP-binding cassette domain-containing protein [Thermanaeromonas sp. C210]MBE3581530.1 ATP-binding cassette domain-containing protein [Thermoanaerobacteraceae bacterium]GFN23512.1 energy-coupling factor ABC transporter ATP-binding protein [Thermanaeromonas sp. C210]
MEAILAARDLEFTYPDGTAALRGLSLEIERGSKVAVLGPNGAGKSTLFLHFNGIFRPRRGKIFWQGQEVHYDRSSLAGLRQKVGIVFQDPDSQLFAASVFQEVSFGPLNVGLPSDEVKRRVEEAMAATGITDLADKPTHFLSYGQKKRVCIAAVLAMEPEVIILDEPTASLDPYLSSQVIGLMDEINRAGKTVVLSTHDVDLAYSWADRIFVLKSGQLLAGGRPEEVFLQSQMIQEAGLTLPWILEVYLELQKRGWSLGPRPPRCKEALWACLPSASQAPGPMLKLAKG